MNKILILLIGFAFTQSIQTKQIEVPVTQDTELIDISQYIDLVEGYYNVEIIYIENFDFEVFNSEQWFDENIEFVSPYEYGGTLQVEVYRNNIEDENGNQIDVYESYNAYHPAIITQNNSIFTKHVNDLDNTDWSYSGMFIMNITGLFEDEYQNQIDDINDLLSEITSGDMNLDGNINVQDIIALVNVILGEEG